jgi:hypothetical protein
LRLRGSLQGDAAATERFRDAKAPTLAGGVNASEEVLAVLRRHSG